MTETTSAEAVQRELGGCPVMHRDFSGSQAAGCHWELAEELREASPLYFNTFAQGYWVFTRYDAVRDMYKNPEIFSSESITP
jgi:cytochrome P450